MKLSIIIVNYNVRYFLEQALRSVEKAAKNLNIETFVVDNNSTDNSMEMVREKFPWVYYIQNQENVGFSKANNQAIELAQGEYILLLNPDTVINEDTLEKCVAFMDNHPDAGGLGVKMIDGSGRFLPESKRGLPTPFVAFCKTFGLSKIFPKSKTFNHYHLGHLPENETNEIEVIAGAFMFLRKSVLDEIGMLDEAFFMYGEDIDLSYRILKAGYKNYYFSETTILHYKGESTKKGSLNYVKTFYQAMMIFAKKHFTKEQAGVYMILINLAIYLRGFLTVINNFFKKICLPVLDFSVILLGLFTLKNLWANYYFNNPEYYDSAQLWINFPIYAGIWTLSIFLNSDYDYPFQLKRILRGILLGTLVLAALYGFLEMPFRFSRALILLGAAMALVLTFFIRNVLHLLQFKSLVFTQKKQNMLIVGSAEESQRVQHLLEQIHAQKNILGTISPSPKFDQAAYLSNIENLEEVCRINKVTELIFCAKDVPNDSIMKWMSQLGSHIQYRIVPKESLNIIGSQSKNRSGEVYTLEVQFNLSNPFQRRNKRLFDIVLAIVLIVISPIMLLLGLPFGKLLKNCFDVLLGKKTWVSYAGSQNTQLPSIKQGILNPLDELDINNPKKEIVDQLNLVYARDYQIAKDLMILRKAWRKLTE